MGERRDEAGTDRRDPGDTPSTLAAESERDRLRAILCDPHAELRERYARHLAMETDLSAGEAVALLRGAPVDPLPAPRNTLGDQPR